MFDRMYRSGALQWLAVALVAIVLVAIWTRRVDSRPVHKDANQNVLMAVNLAHQGVMSEDETPPYTPTDYREPLPIFFTALAVRLVDAQLGPAAADAYAQGERVRLLKIQNILWLALLCVGTFCAVRLLSSSFYLALLGVVLVATPFFAGQTELNDLYTEVPAATFLMFASLSLAWAIRSGRLRAAVVTGALFGLLTLTKAANLYVFVGVIAVVAVIRPWLDHGGSPRRAAMQLGAMLLAFGCIVGPWILRNRIELGTYHISQRAGVVLMQRADYDLMSPEEIRGSFYVWADPRLQPLLGHLLGFSPADLQRHGRLQRLNEGDSDFAAEDLAAEQAGRPERALTYYRQARAERVKAAAMLYAAGNPESDIAADDLVTSDALRIIEHHLGNHCVLTIALLWRGATLMFPVLAIVLWMSTRRRQWDLVGFAIAAFGAALFYALFSEFLGRFALPLRPIAVVALLVFLHRMVAAKLARGHPAFDSRTPVNSREPA